MFISTPRSIPPRSFQPILPSSWYSLIILQRLSLRSPLSIFMLNHSPTIYLIHSNQHSFLQLPSLHSYLIWSSQPPLICSACYHLICLLRSSRCWTLITPLMIRSDLHCSPRSSQLALTQLLNFPHYLNFKLKHNCIFHIYLSRFYIYHQLELYLLPSKKN